VEKSRPSRAKATKDPDEREPLVVDEPVRGGALSSWLLVLWHGAGGDVDERSMVAVARAAAEQGALVVRARFPYRLAGKRAPDRMPALIESARSAIAAARSRPGAAKRKLALGGRSMGGRVASMLVADGFEAQALVFLSYPLHPAGKPEQLRDAHLPAIPCPMLFVEGDRDTLCDLALLRPVLERIGARAELEVFPGADHGMKKAPAPEIARVVTEFLARAATAS
jgi:uncharacterized protein